MRIWCRSVPRCGFASVNERIGATNWLATPPGKGYFAILGLYGPTEAAIDKTWKPGDIEKQN
jgi:hypothetical protein